MPNVAGSFSNYPHFPDSVPTNLVDLEAERNAMRSNAGQESSAVGYSQDLFDNAKQSVSDAQETAKELADAANVANKEFYDESWVKSEEAAENAYNRQVRWLEDYYPSLLKSIKAAGLNPNLVLSGGASVSAPSAAMASGDTLNMNKAQLVYDNLYMQLLREQMTDSNKVLTTSISSLSNLLGQAMKLI